MEPQQYGMSRFAGFFEGGYVAQSITPLAIHANNYAALMPMNEDNNLPSAVVVPFGKLSSDLIRLGLYRVVIGIVGGAPYYSTFPFSDFLFGFPSLSFKDGISSTGQRRFLLRRFSFGWLIWVDETYLFLFTFWALDGFHAGSFQLSLSTLTIPYMLFMGTFVSSIFFYTEACLVFPGLFSTWFIRTSF
ncbi:hypothetical protein BGX38DRAFT_718468 [Terfezia claveryi]|nr:hypothetical protein BGX38DRAFT_718468 [Terfezia claveryi]